jgi:serine/threonine-protein phosphatase 4 regulatory subunit 1
MSEAHPAPRPSNPEQDALASTDDNLSDVDKLSKYILSPIPLQRLVYVKRFTDTAKDAGINTTIDKLVPLLDVIPKDSEHVIRQALAQELQTFAEFLLTQNTHNDDFKATLDSSHPYQVFLSSALPCLHRLLADPTQEVRDVASQSLLALTPRLHGMHLETELLKPIIALLKVDHLPIMDDEQKGSAITVLNDVSPIIGASLAQELIVPEIVSLSQDPSFRVRKACAQNYGNVSKAVGAEFAVPKLLPSFVKLANDTIWSVRKGCVESLVDVAAAVDKDVRQNVLIPMLTKFTSDVSRWVRNAAYRCLGPFIYECEAELITPSFLELFTGIPKLSNSLVDAEVNFFCAYNFPAVVLRLGPQRWNELLPTYQTLCKDTKVRRPYPFRCRLILL